MSDNVVKVQKEIISNYLKLNTEDSVAICINKGEKWAFFENVHFYNAGELSVISSVIKIDNIQKEIDRIRRNYSKKTIKVFEFDDYDRLPSKLIENVTNTRIITPLITR